MAMVTRVARNAIIDPVIQQLTDLINEDNRQIVQTDLRGMESLLQDIVTPFFRDPQKAPPEFVNIWLQLLRNSLSEARRLIDCSGRRQRCLDWVVNNPRRPSKQKRAWNALFDQLYRGFQSDLSILVTSLHFVSLKPLHKEEAVLRDKAASKFVGSGTASTLKVAFDYPQNLEEVSEAFAILKFKYQRRERILAVGRVMELTRPISVLIEAPTFQSSHF